MKSRGINQLAFKDIFRHVAEYGLLETEEAERGCRAKLFYLSSPI